MSRKENCRKLNLYQCLVNAPWAALATLLGWAFLGVLGTGAYLGWQVLREPTRLPLTQITLQGELRYQPRTELENQIRHWLQADNLVTLDVHALRTRLEALPWIAQAEVRKRWPGQVEITVRERQPFARWNDQELVTVAGLRFQPLPEQIPSLLPKLSGPEGYERRLIQQYQLMTQRLKAVDLTLAEVHLDQRLSWRALLTTGTELQLGTTQVGPHLQRFLAQYAHAFAGAAPRMARIDLRYPYGFTIAWRDAPVVEAEHG